MNKRSLSFVWCMPILLVDCVRWNNRPLIGGGETDLDHPGRAMWQSSVPLYGSIRDQRYFYITVEVGTPSHEFELLVDTGSSMSYIPCKSCGANCGRHKSGLFDTVHSSTYRMVHCTNLDCMGEHCRSGDCECHPSQACKYGRNYAENSTSEGYMMHENVRLKDGSGPFPVVLGCQTKETGEIFQQEVDGILGLGLGSVSVFDQLVSQGVFEDTFSICMGGWKGGGALIFGESGVDACAPSYTPLLRSAVYYSVEIEGLRVNERRLPFSQDSFSAGYGAVLDSGTTFSYFPTSIHATLVEAISDHVFHVGGLQAKRLHSPVAEHCWQLRSAQLSRVFPIVKIDFSNGTSLDLKPVRYLYRQGEGLWRRTYCLGIFDNGSKGTILGAIAFRDVLVEYDRRNGRVGFLEVNCAEVFEKQQGGLAVSCGDASKPSNEDTEGWRLIMILVVLVPLGIVIRNLRLYINSCIASMYL